MANRGALERRRRDERKQAGHVGQHLGRCLKRGVDLGLGGAEVERERHRVRLQALQQLVRVTAVAGLGRHAPRRCVGMGEQSKRFELGQLATNSGGGDRESDPLDQGLRADGLTRRDVLLDEPAQERPLSIGQLGWGCIPHLCRGF